jgi:hypothetical protein
MEWVGSGSPVVSLVSTTLLSWLVHKFPQPTMHVDEQWLTETGAHVISRVFLAGIPLYSRWDGMSAGNLCTAGSLPRD